MQRAIGRLTLRPGRLHPRHRTRHEVAVGIKGLCCGFRPAPVAAEDLLALDADVALRAGVQPDVQPRQGLAHRADAAVAVQGIREDDARLCHAVPLQRDLTCRRHCLRDFGEGTWVKKVCGEVGGLLDVRDQTRACMHAPTTSMSTPRPLPT